MKRILTVALACVLLVGCVLSFASCGFMFGTYENDALDMSWEFTAYQAVKNVDGLTGDYRVIYTFKIDDDEIILTPKEYQTDDDGEIIQEFVEEMNEKIAEDEEGKLVETYEFKKGDGYIEINDVKFEKK